MPHLPPNTHLRAYHTDAFPFKRPRHISYTILPYHIPYYAANGILNLLKKRCETNSLRLNANKTQAILFRTRNTVLPTLPKQCIADEEIKIVSQIKTLGVIFSEHLSWDQHVELICSKLNKITGVLNRPCHFLPC